MFKVCLINELNERACSQRNALTERPASIALNAGTVGTVLEVLDGGDALLVEFGPGEATAAIGLASCTPRKSSRWRTHRPPERSGTLQQPSFGTTPSAGVLSATDWQASPSQAVTDSIHHRCRVEHGSAHLSGCAGSGYSWMRRRNPRLASSMRPAKTYAGIS